MELRDYIKENTFSEPTPSNEIEDSDNSEEVEEETEKINIEE